jgi:hypothetical protein
VPGDESPAGVFASFEIDALVRLVPVEEEIAGHGASLMWRGHADIRGTP